jgi:hypothetical protein
MDTDTTGQNGAYVITVDDRVILGQEEPKYRVGLLNSFTYKDLSFSFFLNSVQGGKDGYMAYNEPNIGAFGDVNGVLFNYLDDADFWSPSNPNGVNPRYETAPRVNAGKLYQRNFIRLQDITLAYNLPKPMLNKLGISNAKLFASGKNLATWTKWKGWDPETGQGLSDSGRPVLKGYSFGLNITF